MVGLNVLGVENFFGIKGVFNMIGKSCWLVVGLCFCIISGCCLKWWLMVCVILILLNFVVWFGWEL